MTNSNNYSNRASASTLFVAVAVAPFVFASCGGLSKSDRETVEIPPVAVGTDGSAVPVTIVAPAATTPAPAAPTPAAPPYSLNNAVKYVVESGDSLSVIAAKHGASMADVMTANNIKDANKIRSGQTLLLPGKPAESPGVIATEVTPTTATESGITNLEVSDGDASALRLPAISGE